jgi:Holliday junction resolvase
MSRSQRDKGARYEREIAHKLGKVLGTQLRRNITQYQAKSQPDIVAGNLAIECKRRARIGHVYEWLEQARAAAGERLPVVVARADHKPDIVIMDLSTFVQLLVDR